MIICPNRNSRLGTAAKQRYPLLPKWFSDCNGLDFLIPVCLVDDNLNVNCAWYRIGIELLIKGTREIWISRAELITRDTGDSFKQRCTKKWMQHLNSVRTDRKGSSNSKRVSLEDSPFHLHYHCSSRGLNPRSVIMWLWPIREASQGSSRE